MSSAEVLLAQPSRRLAGFLLDLLLFVLTFLVLAAARLMLARLQRKAGA